MHGNDYQAHANRTRQAYDSPQIEMVFAALEMSAEVGEVANLVYKHAFQQHDLDREDVKEELGDALWGMAVLCHAVGITLDDVMAYNIAKLCRRYPDGWTREASLARVDHATPAKPVTAQVPLKILKDANGVPYAQGQLAWEIVED